MGKAQVIQVAYFIPDQHWSGSIALTMDALKGIDRLVAYQGIDDAPGYEICLLHHPNTTPQGISGMHFDSEPLDSSVYDVVILPAVWSISPKEIKDYSALPDWLRRQYEQGAHLLSITNGAFFLAEADLLRDQEITIHWAFKDLFQSLYPQVKVRSDLQACYTGRIWSSSGISPSLDMIHQLIRRFSGETVAQACSKYFMIEQMDQAALDNTAAITQVGKDHLVRAIRDWIALNYHRPMNGQDIADSFHMSYRNLNRRFVDETGLALYEYLQTVRQDKAAKMIANSRLSIEQIAQQCGFNHPGSFSRSFRKRFGRSPQQYRTFMRTN